MLVLARGIDESVTLKTPEGKTIRVQVLEVRGWGDLAKVRLGFQADRDVVIHRDEIWRLLDDAAEHDRKKDAS